MLNRWHAEDREVVLHQLGTDPVRGLAPAESSRRLREHGPNLIHGPRPSSPARLLARQDTSLLMLVLLLAAVVSGFLGEWLDAVAIAAIVVLNGLLGFVQDRHTERSLAALQRLSAPSARVVRGGKSFLIPAGELVPGDLAQVAAGDRVPADMRLFHAQGLSLDESALTGESLPVGKDPALVLPEDAALADRANMLFAGTVVTAGRGAAIVTATGMRTELGGIARLLGQVEFAPTPLRLRLAELGQVLASGCLALCALVFAAGRFHGQSTMASFLAAVSLAVAAIPEGLPAVLRLSLALGVRRMRRRRVTVRASAAVETLGAVTVIATDKTRTLTCNELTVRELVLEEVAIRVAGNGYSPEGEILRDGVPVDPAAWETLGIALRIAAASSSRLTQDADGVWKVLGDPTDGALLALAAKGGLPLDDPERERQVIARFAHSAERRRLTVLVSGRGGRPLALTRGAPDAVLAHCLHQRTAVGVRPLSPADRERILRRCEELNGRALRVLGLAYREDAAGDESRTVERSMVWVGLVGLMDPPRPEAAAAIDACRAAGITSVIITGDQKPAALAVAREIGALRPGDEAITGEELDQMTPEALGACVERYRIFARVTAEHKLRIIRAWKHRGHLIAMTGDGVNDAPALKEADVGIAMGRGGADVTREAAALVLADDTFAAIIAAVAESRGIYENVRRFIIHLLSCNAAATLLILSGALAGLPLPLVPLQLLWINLVLAGLPALALGVEAHDPGLMRAPPRSPRERLLGKETVLQLGLEGAAMAAVSLAAYLLAWRGGAGEEVSARTQAFTVLGLSQLVQAFSCRDRSRSLFATNLFSNHWLLGAVALAGLLLLASVQVGALRPVFQTEALGRQEWSLIAALAMVPLAVSELIKLWLRKRADR